jgi:hypothetical protein
LGQSLPSFAITANLILVYDIVLNRRSLAFLEKLIAELDTEKAYMAT